MAASAVDGEVRKVFVLPPTRRDGDVTCTLLKDGGLDCDVVVNAHSLAAHMSSSVGAVVLTDAVVSDPGLSSVLDAIERQPQWSDVPVILLTRPDTQSPIDKRRFQTLTNLTLLDRPTSSPALVSAVAT